MNAGTLVACDLDGTLSFDGGAPAPDVIAALEALASTRGIRLTVATARSPRVVAEWFGPLGRHLSAVCCNGAIVRTPRRELLRRPLDADLVRRLVGALTARGERYCLEYGDRFVASHADALPWMGTRARVLDPAAPAAGVVKVSIATGAGWLDELRDLVGGAARVVPHATGDADVVADGVGKADGVQVLARRIAPRGATIVALGNDLNDLDLLRAADRAFVVGDGLAALDAHAHIERVAADPAGVAGVLRAQIAAAGSRPRLRSVLRTRLRPAASGTSRPVVVAPA